MEPLTQPRRDPPASRSHALLLLDVSRASLGTEGSNQGSDSGSLAGLRDSPNRTSRSVQKCTENMLIWDMIFRWGTGTLEANEKPKVYRSVQKCTAIFRWGTGTLDIKKMYKVYKSVQICMYIFRCDTSSLKMLYFLYTFLRQDLASEYCIS